MKQKYVIGNWKTNPASHQQAQALAESLKTINVHLKVGCVPSFVHLGAVASTLSGSQLWVGVQDVCAFTAENGAFTGDVSAAQAADMGAKFTLVGHSERRQYHAEIDEILVKKIRNAFTCGLSVIYCIGETKDEYERGDTEQVLERQMELLERFASEIPFVEDVAFPKLIIAYEPVWAIGTGLTPTFDEIEGAHNVIGELLSTFEISAPIIYGGSVNEKNAPEFAKSVLIDGALVGGASLKIDSFAHIVSAFSQ